MPEGFKTKKWVEETFANLDEIVSGLGRDTLALEWLKALALAGLPGGQKRGKENRK